MFLGVMITGERQERCHFGNICFWHFLDIALPILVERLFFNRIDTETTGATVGSQHNLVVLAGSDETESLLPLTQLAFARTEIALYAPIIDLMPISSGDYSLHRSLHWGLYCSLYRVCMRIERISSQRKLRLRIFDWNSKAKVAILSTYSSRQQLNCWMSNIHLNDPS